MRCSITFLICGLAAAPAAAQTGETELREVVKALLGADVQVGQLAAASPLATLIPDGSRVIGSVDQGWGTTALLGMRGTREEVIRALDAKLRASGWNLARKSCSPVPVSFLRRWAAKLAATAPTTATSAR